MDLRKRIKPGRMEAILAQGLIDLFDPFDYVLDHRYYCGELGRARLLPYIGRALAEESEHIYLSIEGEESNKDRLSVRLWDSSEPKIKPKEFNGHFDGSGNSRLGIELVAMAEIRREGQTSGPSFMPGYVRHLRELTKRVGGIYVYGGFARTYNGEEESFDLYRFEVTEGIRR